MTPVSSWGRLSADPHHLEAPGDPVRLAAMVAGGAGPGVAYGMGRSYGDVCLNAGGRLWLTAGLDHLIGFDAENGRLACEAGVMLRDIQRLAIPRGWMLPVVPGTQWVTVGGAIANDVHGKNHHRLGSFGDHVLTLTLLRTDGEAIDCGPDLKPDWFAATVGGLGLTGVIARAEIQLRRVPGPWLDTETVPYAGLGDFFSLADASEADWEHTVSWIDCFSGDRGLFMRGNPVDVGDRPEPRARSRAVPFTPPVSLINRLTLRPLSSAYYLANRLKPRRAIAHYEPFFHPLDGLAGWNRIYGPQGFYQHQSVVPRQSGQDAVQAMLKEIARSGEGSFLVVLKTFGDRAPVGMLSFPMPGATLAMDFPNNGAPTLALLARLDAVVREAGGRIYAAKDARMPRDLFESGYPRLDEFVKYRDPGISSGLSRRLMGS